MMYFDLVSCKCYLCLGQIRRWRHKCGTNELKLRYCLSVDIRRLLLVIMYRTVYVIFLSLPPSPNHYIYARKTL